MNNLIISPVGDNSLHNSWISENKNFEYSLNSIPDFIKSKKSTTSENKPCLFNKKWSQDLIKDTPKKGSVDGSLYIKANKKIIDYYLSYPEKLDIDIQNVACQGEEYIKGYTENKKLIDFSELPDEYVKDVNTMYHKLFRS